MFDFDSNQATRRQGPRGSFDLPLLVALIGLASVGVVMVASSSIAVADSEHKGAFYFLIHHLVFLSLGLAATGIAMRTELKLFEKYAFHLMLLAFAAGSANLMWMAMLTAMMVYEKTGRYGRELSRAFGAAFLLWGGALLLHAAV